MNAGQKKVVQRQRPTTRADVVNAAWELADERGIDGVSIRAVAARLNLNPTSLYNHVASRSDLLGEMWRTALSKLELPPKRADPHQEVLVLIAAVFEFSRAYAQLSTYGADIPQLFNNWEHLTERLASALLTLGYDTESAVDVYAALWAAALGFGSLAAEFEKEPPQRFARRQRDHRKNLLSGNAPALAALNQGPPVTVEELFERSVRAILRIPTTSKGNP